MRCGWKWVVLWSLWAARLVRQPTAPRRVSGGLLRGSVAHDGSHVQYFNVPYATVIQRFQAPGPEPAWERIFEAVNENIGCPQKFGNIVIGNENCLTLNVYTPLEVAPNKLLPVMVWIHGGAFSYGSGSRFLYGPDYLVTKGVILVTINYRLDILGFLCLGIKEAPGNAGMKDQVAALKWVQRNIKVFDGDPDNVTIFGESAGASSVSLHVISPMSKGLFHKAITQSGSSLAALAIQLRPVYMARLLAKAMGHDTSDPYELYNLFVHKTNSELILTTVPREDGNLWLSQIMRVPCVEQGIEDAFLSEMPYEVLLKGQYHKVPMLIGTNIEEGYFFVAYENDTMLPKITFERSMPKDLDFPTDKEQREAAEKFKMFYMGDDEISSKTVLKLSKLYGEVYFNYPSLEETEIILGTTDRPVFNYLFGYDGLRNLAKFSSGYRFATAPGATHADEFFYLFKTSILPSLFENKMIDTMTTLWTNFAKHGEPIPAPIGGVQWAPTDHRTPRAFVIDEPLGSAPLWHSESLQYWRQIYAKYRRKGY